MQVKPRIQAFVILGAMAFAALLSYGILHHSAPEPVKSMEKFDTQPPLPEAVFYDADGDKKTLADFKGDVLLVNLWATWCTPCVAELPALERLQGKLKDDGMKVIAISVDRGPVEDVAAFLDNKGIEALDLYVDTDRDIPSKWKYAAIPASFLIDREGNVIQTFSGPQEWDKGDIFARIEQVLQ